MSDSSFATATADATVSASEITPSSTDASTTATSTDPSTTVPARRSVPTPTLAPRQTSNDTADPFAFVNNSDEESPANSSDYQSLSNAAIAEADAYSKNKSLTTADGPNAVYISIVDLSNSYQLQADTDGNLYLGDIGSSAAFVSDQGFVLGDDAEQWFHYYPDVMAKYNVSRLRVSSSDAIPKDADFVALVPVDYDDNPTTPSVYAGLDTTGGIFFTLTCNIQGQASKIFLATDPVEGAKMLMEEKLRYTVTGGVVEDCWYMPWAVPATKQ